jgi:hypothetical protein
MTHTELLDQSFNIAWSVLDRSGDLGEPEACAEFLFGKINEMMARGENRRLVLSNAAIDAYRQRYKKLVLIS